MKSSAKNIELKLYDELFMTDEDRKEEQKEKVEQVDIANIVDFPNHPFKILRNEDLMRVVESIQNNGVINPCLGREVDGKIQLVSGHRRKAACEFLGIRAMPVIVREMTDEQAVITMVDANIQRETILPSEKAFAYKMKMEALKSQGKRTDLTSSQVGTKFRADELLAQNTDDSRSTIQRFIRLTYLIPELLDKVDSKEMAMSPAVEISYMSVTQQKNYFPLWNFTIAVQVLLRQLNSKIYRKNTVLKTVGLIVLWQKKSQIKWNKSNLKRMILKSIFLAVILTTKSKTTLLRV